MRRRRPSAWCVVGIGLALLACERDAGAPATTAALRVVELDDAGPAEAEVPEMNPRFGIAREGVAAFGAAAVRFTDFDSAGDVELTTADDSFPDDWDEVQSSVARANAPLAGPALTLQSSPSSPGFSGSSRSIPAIRPDALPSRASLSFVSSGATRRASSGVVPCSR